jgi:hypothetical protein
MNAPTRPRSQRWRVRVPLGRATSPEEVQRVLDALAYLDPQLESVDGAPALVAEVLAPTRSAAVQYLARRTSSMLAPEAEP